MLSALRVFRENFFDFFPLGFFELIEKISGDFGIVGIDSHDW
jgi:hypothetical protein